jgi:hypothetical protein
LTQSETRRHSNVEINVNVTKQQHSIGGRYLLLAHIKKNKNRRKEMKEKRKERETRGEEKKRKLRKRLKRKEKKGK